MGIKVRFATGWKQKFYFSRVFNTIAVNIFLASKMVTFLTPNQPEFSDSHEAQRYYQQLQVSGAVAHDRYLAEIQA